MCNCRGSGQDIIISGGENISTVEVEQALVSHDAVLDVAVIGVPDEKWGERPAPTCSLVPGATLTADELIDYARNYWQARSPRHHLPRRSAPHLLGKGDEVRAA